MAKRFQVDSGGTLTTSLISYYKCEDANDFYASNNLTAAGNATFAAGKVNNATSLDGTDDYLDGGDVMDFARTNAFSIAAWVNPDVIASSRTIVSKYDGVSDSPGYLLYNIATGKIRFILQDNAGSHKIQVATSSAVLSIGTWAHVVMTYSGSAAASGVKIYINGSSVGLTTEADTLSSGDTTNAVSFNIGSSGDGGFADFDGLIDEVGVWSKALSSTEVTDLYNGGSGQTMIDTTFTPLSNLTLMGVG